MRETISDVQINQPTPAYSPMASGFGFLLIRAVVVQIFHTASLVILSRYLTPSDFGVFSVLLFIVMTMGLYLDVGLGASLIRQPEQPTTDELSTLLTVQVLFSLALIGLVWILTPVFLHYFAALEVEHEGLIKALSFSVLIKAFRTPQLVALEKRLEFKTIGIVEMIEALTYNITAIMMAFFQFGLWSLVWAMIAKFMVGTLIYMGLKTAPIQLGFNVSAFKKMIGFGAAFQTNAMINNAKDMVIPLFGGALLSSAQLGYVSWAKDLAARPTYLAELFNRVALPAFSIHKNDSQNLSRLVSKSIRLLLLLMLPIAITLTTTIPLLVQFVFSEQWEAAIPCFYFFACSIVSVSWAAPLLNAIIIRCEVKTLYRFSIIFFIGEWLMGIGGMTLFGYVGAAASVIPLIALSAWLYLKEARKLDIQTSFPTLVMKPLLIGGAIALFFVLMQQFFTVTTFEMFLTVEFGVLSLSCLILWGFHFNDVLEALRSIPVAHRFIEPFSKRFSKTS